MTAPASAHPRSVEQLLPDALALAASQSEPVTRNQLMRKLHIGAPKADALLDELRALADVETGKVVPGSEAGTDVADPWALAAPVSPAGPVADYIVEPARALAIESGSAESEPAVEPEPLPQVAVDGHPGPKVAGEQPVKPAAAGLEEAPKPASEPTPEVASDPGPKIAAEPRRRLASWPVWLIALPAAVAIWGGWVGLGGLTGFGYINLLPGIVADGSWATINSAITLPIGVEAYAAYALRAWLSGRVPERARRFARWSAIASLLVGALGQVAYHVLVAAGITAAPWWITTLVACLPVTVLGMAATLAHLIREGEVR